MEIADIFVVNKSDREGSKQMVNVLKFLTETSPSGHDTWQIPIMPTNGLDGTGTEELLQTIKKYIEFIQTHQETALFFRKRLLGLKQLIIEQLSVRIDSTINEGVQENYRKELSDPSISLYSIFNRIMHDKDFADRILK
jgi:LAO/AO transport system kinase